jgi:hypothetical protein
MYFSYQYMSAKLSSMINMQVMLLILSLISWSITNTHVIKRIIIDMQSLTEPYPNFLL